MSIDLTRLSPAPWFNWSRGTKGEFGLFCGDPNDPSDIYDLNERDEETDLEFVALARNAFEVMMRRGWSVRRTVDHHWMVVGDNDTWLFHPKYGDYFMEDNPFTSLIEADKWYRENVDKAKLS
jgi:hypothetical protein